MCIKNPAELRLDLILTLAGLLFLILINYMLRKKFPGYKKYPGAMIIINALVSLFWILYNNSPLLGNCEG